MESRDIIADLLRGGIADRDDAARERARLRLRQATTDELRSSRRGHRRLLYAVAASLAIAMLIMVAQVWLPLGQGGLDSSSAAELQRLGEISSQRSAPELLPGEFIYRRYLEVGRESVGSVSTGLLFSIDVTVEVEVWLASDGSGRMQTTYLDVSFSSKQDQTLWEQAGSQEIPRVGKTLIADYGPDGLSYFPVERLPTDPDALRQALADGTVIEPAPGDVNELSTIGSLLAQEDGDGDLRQALFDLLASIPNVTVSTDVVDPLDRPAVEVAISDDAGVTSLLLDPVDARLLARTRTPPADERPPLTYWQAYEQSSIVSRIGDRAEP